MFGSSVSTAGELYVAMRDDYGLYLAFLSQGPVHLESEVTEVLLIDNVDAPEVLRVGGVRRVVTGATRFRMSWALSPLTDGSGSKDFFRSGWPDAIVLHAPYSIADASEAYWVAVGARSDPSAKLPRWPTPQHHRDDYRLRGLDPTER